MVAVAFGRTAHCCNRLWLQSFPQDSSLKLENGSLIRVPLALITRLKNHYMRMINNTLNVLWGTNGNIWIQRKLKEEREDANLAKLQEQLQQEHTNTPVMPDEQLSIARLRNLIECMRLVHYMVTPEYAEEIYNASVQLLLKPTKMPCRNL
jgi:exosome complex RNA-binding protein Rrp4